MSLIVRKCCRLPVYKYIQNCAVYWNILSHADHHNVKLHINYAVFSQTLTTVLVELLMTWYVIKTSSERYKMPEVAVVSTYCGSCCCMWVMSHKYTQIMGPILTKITNYHCPKGVSCNKVLKS